MQEQVQNLSYLRFIFYYEVYYRFDAFYYIGVNYPNNIVNLKVEELYHDNIYIIP